MTLRHILPLLALAAGTFTACDEIDEDQRFTPTYLSDTGKHVLIEDFTGQRCSNCPLAAELISTLQATYGSERVVAVALHGGSLSIDENLDPTRGLANTQGQAYHEHWNVESWPKGMVDRTGGLLDYALWTTPVLQRLAQQPTVQIDLSGGAVTYDAESRTVTIRPTITAGQALSGQLQVWLTESNLVRRQLMPAQQQVQHPEWRRGYNDEYVHNHVFRASVNDPYGDAVNLGEGETLSPTYTYTLNEGWKAENMAVVVFVYNDADGVLQVADQKIL